MHGNKKKNVNKQSTNLTQKEWADSQLIGTEPQRSQMTHVTVANQRLL